MLSVRCTLYELQMVAVGSIVAGRAVLSQILFKSESFHGTRSGDAKTLRESSVHFA